MPLWCAVVGISLFSVTFYDMVWTTLSASETGLVSLAVVYVFKYVSYICRTHLGAHWILQGIGVMTFLATICMWYLLTWMSLALIFLTVEGSLISSYTNNPATFFQTIYFTGYTFFTLGLGDFRPTSNFFMLYTAFVSGCGIFLVSISA